jgi:hypothetical protein
MKAPKEAVMRHDRPADPQHKLSAVDAYMLCSVCGDLADQRDRRHAELGRLLLLPARGAGLMLPTLSSWYAQAYHPRVFVRLKKVSRGWSAFADHDELSVP